MIFVSGRLAAARSVLTSGSVGQGLKTTALGPRLACSLFLYDPHTLVSLMVKKSAYNAEDLGLILESGRSPREGNGNPLQYPCLGNPKDRGAWQATAHGVVKSQA